MCGIAGYIGPKKALPILFSGLKRLEYRGYDSYGFLVIKKDGLPFLHKKRGKISDDEKELLSLDIDGNIGIAHTRWGTTGEITPENAHPHFDCKKEIFIVHNGIIENYKELKQELKSEGHIFSSETDSEVLSHLIEKYLSEPSENGERATSLEDAVRKVLKQIQGTYGIAVVSTREPDKIVAARMSSPLVLGVGKDEFLLASDASAIVMRTRQIVNLDDGEIAVIKPDDFYILKEKKIETIDWDISDIQKSGFPHFMIKEINEEPDAVENAFLGRLIEEDGSVKLGGIDSVSEQISKTERIFLVGCGTAYYAALVGEYLIEEAAKIPAKAEVSSEFRYRNHVFNKNDAAIFISQSGETADTLGALREAKQKRILSIGITNVVGSTQSRETDAGIYSRSGPEIAVASTKAFVGQVTTLVLLTVFLGRQRRMDLEQGKKIIKELKLIPDLIKEILSQQNQIKKIAEEYSHFDKFMFLGRKYNFPIALEGALKLREVSYLQSQGYAAGEMKHGSIALIDQSLPAIAICPKDSVYEKMISSIEEIRTRKGPIIALATKGDEKIKRLADKVIYLPKTIELLAPLLNVVPLHLFAYYMGVAKGYDVDKPRNLAKSVTVE